MPESGIATFIHAFDLFIGAICALASRVENHGDGAGKNIFWVTPVCPSLHLCSFVFHLLSRFVAERRRRTSWFSSHLPAAISWCL
jgi:hypothetical protein